MRDLFQPRVLSSATGAALATAVLCLPRFLLWHERVLPVWYLEALIFLGTIVLWAFVFAWHRRYSGRPVLTLAIGSRWAALSTLGGMAAAFALHRYLDPQVRAFTPQDYPVNFREWLAMALFALAFTQLFLLFAPFAWLIRLWPNRAFATIGTIVFSVVVLALKAQSLRTQYPPLLFSTLLLSRALGTWLSVILYLRGGVLLASWWGCLMEARLLLDL